MLEDGKEAKAYNTMHKRYMDLKAMLNITNIEYRV